MLRPIFFLLLASAPAWSAGPTLKLRDPNFYPVLEKNSRTECRHLRDRSYGFLLERGETDEIQVHVISQDKVEGESSAFRAEVARNSFDGVLVRHVSRQGQFGKVVEIQIGRRSNAELGYGLPAMIVMATHYFTSEPGGKEKEDVYLDGNYRLVCQLPRSNR